MTDFRTGPLNLLKKEAYLFDLAIADALEQDKADIARLAKYDAERAAKLDAETQKWKETDFETVRNLLQWSVDRISESLVKIDSTIEKLDKLSKDVDVLKDKVK